MQEILLACITTVVGLIGGAFVSVKLSKNKRPCWYYKMNMLFSKGISEVEDLKITYKDYDINNLSSIYFAFWNNGKETITSNDVAETIAFCVSEGHRIYHAEVIKTTTPSNEFNVSISDDGSDAEISFRYLDYKQGAVIQIFSDCDDIKHIDMKGAVMGCKRFKDKKYINLSHLDAFIVPLFSCGSLFFLTVVEDLMITIFIMALYTAIAVAAVISYRYITEKARRLPKDLRKYFIE